MFFKQDIIKDLENLKINKNGILFVHISLKSIGELENGADTLIDSLMEYMKDGLLVIPTHTWDNISVDKNNTMNVLETPTCIGIVPEIFRKREGVLRSLHPTHSVGAFGVDAESFIEGEEFINTPCGKNSVYHKLLTKKATILLIGVDFTRNTFIHGIEEWNNVPNRLSKYEHKLYVINKNGEKLFTPQFRHDGGLGSETYWKLHTATIKTGAMYEGKIGNAKTKVCDAYKLNEVLSNMLKIDIDLLTDNNELDLKKYNLD